METTTRFTGLDGLRGIFCIGLVIYHINDVFHSAFNTLLWPIYQYGGYFGNYIFFMMSGLLISCYYKEQVCTQVTSFYQYTTKRILKLYPLYLLSNLTMILYILFKDYATNLDPVRLCASFLILPSGWFTQVSPYNHPAWFICVLILCYILYYIIGKLSYYFSNLYLPLCIFFIFWGMFLEIKAWKIPFNFRICGEGYMNFFIGVLLAEILIHSKNPPKKMLTFNCACLGFIITNILLLSKIKVPPLDMRWIITFICSNLTYAAIRKKYAIKLLSLHIIQKIGQYSFSIYIWHVPVVWWFLYIQNFLGLTSIDKRLNMILFFIVLFFVTRISYRCFEK